MIVSRVLPIEKNNNYYTLEVVFCKWRKVSWNKWNLHTFVSAGENARFGQFSDICNLIGLYKSLEYPKKFIRQAKVDRYGVCSLTDINGVVSTYFSIKDLYIIPVFNTYSMNTYF